MKELSEKVKDAKIDRYFNLIIEILERCFGDQKVKVYLYGSRARGDENSASDIDLAIESPDAVEYKISTAKEAFFESHIPYKVDIVDCKTAGKELKENIKTEGVLIWES